jgi:5-formyltetrahydrofolate cyclo-ligase
MDKDTIRKAMIEMRTALSPKEADRVSQTIQDKVRQRPEYKEARRVAFYYPWKGEVNLLSLASQAVKEGKDVLLPKVQKNILVFCPVKTLEDLKPGFKGIPEPDTPAMPLENIDLFMVPGTAFDLEGYRLGMGKGFYDRTLFLLKKHQISLGIAYNFQVVEKLPREWWDERIDLLITEELVLTPSTTWSLKRRKK